MLLWSVGVAKKSVQFGLGGIHLQHIILIIVTLHVMLVHSPHFLLKRR